MVRIHSVLFGGKYDLIFLWLKTDKYSLQIPNRTDLIFLPTKSAAVGLFNQCQIKLMTWSAKNNIISV